MVNQIEGILVHSRPKKGESDFDASKVTRIQEPAEETGKLKDKE